MLSLFYHANFNRKNKITAATSTFHSPKLIIVKKSFGKTAFIMDVL